MVCFLSQPEYNCQTVFMVLKLLNSNVNIAIKYTLLIYQGIHRIGQPYEYYFKSHAY